jgi:hypothetical protein
MTEPSPRDLHNEAYDHLDEALAVKSTPFKIAQTVTAAWRHAVGDTEGAMYGLIANGNVLWGLIERVVGAGRAEAIAARAEGEAAGRRAAINNPVIGDLMIAWADKIDTRLGPISGRDADALASLLREAAAAFAGIRHPTGSEQFADCLARLGNHCLQHR